MNIQDRIYVFIKLGDFLRQFINGQIPKESEHACKASINDNFLFQIKQAVHYNGWFTEKNVLYAIETWANELTQDNLEKWVIPYEFSNVQEQRVGIVTAGNIPLVGFHDFLSVLISGHKLLVKQSSNDQKLLPIIAEFLICEEPEFKDLIEFTDKPFNNIDAVIATGSNNTARYFEHYFSKYPNIIRKNRNAIAVLNGRETHEELVLLGDDIFRYFGLGCRSVSKIFVPKNYDFDMFFKAIFKQNTIMNYQKYKNNYDYNKAVYLMSGFKLLENGFLLLKEDISYASPIATLFYEYYDDLDILNRKLAFEKEQIQCIVSSDKNSSHIPFGLTQQPKLWEYADGVDTLDFLLKL